MSRKRETANFQDSCPKSGGESGVVEPTPIDLTCGPADERCNDPDFARNNPDLCGTHQISLVLKPEVATVLVGNTVQYKTYTRVAGTETQVTLGLVYSSSNTAIATINASTGLATGVASGIVTITVTWHGLTAHAQLTVIATCGTTEVAIVIDDSLSMSSPFGAGYATRLDYAKALANRFISDTDMAQASIAIVPFNLVPSSYGPSTDTAALISYVNLIPQTTGFTSIGNAIHSAAVLLAASNATQKVMILISDGEERATNDPTELDPVVEADAFKATGGTLAAVGVRASGDGFVLLSKLATDGYLLNATVDNAATVISLVSSLRGYFCGTCGHGAYPDCISAPPSAQAPDDPALPDLESDGGSDNTFTKSSTFTACCPPNQVGICSTDLLPQNCDCVTRTATYTSTISDADAQIHADALARSLAFADLHCCANGPINIVSFGNSNPYPACLKITGAPLTITSLALRLHGFQHSYPGDVAMVLVGPTGRAAGVMVSPGGNNGTGVLELRVQDGASLMPCSALLTSGTYAPTFCGPAPTAVLNAFAPDVALPVATAFSTFIGTNPNGIWHLYVKDLLALNGGIIQSWDLVINGTGTGCNVTLPGSTPYTVKVTSPSTVSTGLTPTCSADTISSDATLWDGKMYKSSTSNVWITSNATAATDIASLAGKRFQTGRIELVSTPAQCYFQLEIFLYPTTTSTPLEWVGRLYGSAGNISPIGRYDRVAATYYGAVACNTTLAYIDVTTFP